MHLGSYSRPRRQQLKKVVTLKPTGFCLVRLPPDMQQPTDLEQTQRITPVLVNADAPIYSYCETLGIVRALSEHCIFSPKPPQEKLNQMEYNYIPSYFRGDRLSEKLESFNYFFDSQALFDIHIGGYMLRFILDASTQQDTLGHSKRI